MKKQNRGYAINLIKYYYSLSEFDFRFLLEIFSLFVPLSNKTGRGLFQHIYAIKHFQKKFTENFLIQQALCFN